MTEFEQLKQIFIQNGWTIRAGRGDHFYVKHPNSPVELLLSRSISGWHNVANLIARAKRIQPDFVYNRRGFTAPKESSLSIKKITEEIQKEEEMKKKNQQKTAVVKPTSGLQSLPKGYPKSKKDGRHFKWVTPGAKVRYSAMTDWDFSDIENPLAIINHPYVIESITKNGKVIIKDCNRETRIEAFANELDLLETKKCNCCGKLLPVSMFPSGFGHNTCLKCYNEKYFKKSKVTTKSDTILDKLIKLREKTDDRLVKQTIDEVHFHIDDDKNNPKVTITFPAGTEEQNAQECIGKISDCLGPETGISYSVLPKPIDAKIVDALEQLAQNTGETLIREMINEMHFHLTCEDKHITLTFILPQGLTNSEINRIIRTVSKQLYSIEPFIKYDYEINTDFITVKDSDGNHYKRIKKEEPKQEKQLPVQTQTQKQTQTEKETMKEENHQEPTIEELINRLKSTAELLRDRGVTVKIKKIKYTVEQEVTVIKKIKQTIKI